MTVNEITAVAVARGLIHPAGKTPEATMSAVLYSHARAHAGAEVVRLFEPGAQRARRGSVRWASSTTAGARARR